MQARPLLPIYECSVGTDPCDAGSFPTAALLCEEDVAAVCDIAGDHDGDGWDNGYECSVGTDPCDAGSFPECKEGEKIRGIVTVPGTITYGPVNMSWVDYITIGDVTYVQSCSADVSVIEYVHWICDGEVYCVNGKWDYDNAVVLDDTCGDPIVDDTKVKKENEDCGDWIELPPEPVPV